MDAESKTFFVKEFTVAYRGLETPYLVQAREHFAVKNSYKKYFNLVFIFGEKKDQKVKAILSLACGYQKSTQ